MRPGLHADRCWRLSHELPVDVNVGSVWFGAETHPARSGIRRFKTCLHQRPGLFPASSAASAGGRHGRFRIRLRNLLKLKSEMAALQQKIAAMAPACHRNPLQRAIGQSDLLRCVSLFVDLEDERMFETRAEHRMRLV